jgi:N-acyl-L-homoserine lactone synthetase
MISVIDRHNICEHPALIDQMFRLRARVFGERLGWDVAVRDGMERDRFDEENPLYVIHSDGEGRLLGSLRLLPTTGPTLFREVFADTFPDASQLMSPAIWECSRFCVDEAAPHPPGRDHVTHASGALIAALGEIGVRTGIESYLGNFDAVMIRIYRRLGCEVDVLGHTDKFGRRVYLGLFPVSAAILRRVQEKLAGVDAGVPSTQPAARQTAPNHPDRIVVSHIA